MCGKSLLEFLEIAGHFSPSSTMPKPAREPASAGDDFWIFISRMLRQRHLEFDFWSLI
jgi:hypothetical protein